MLIRVPRLLKCDEVWCRLAEISSTKVELKK